MKKHYNLLILFFISIFFIDFNLFAQDQNVKNQDASFPGGEFAKLKYIKDNLVLPESLSGGNGGTIVVNVQLNESGKIVNAKVFSSFNTSFNAEALRMVYAMPNWIPQVKNNKPKKAEVYISIPFYKTGDYEFSYKRAIYYFELKDNLMAQLSIQEALRRFPDNIEFVELNSKICSAMVRTDQSCKDLEKELSKVDVEALFPGGENVLVQFISKNTRYPMYDRENDIQGSVQLTYIVDDKGNVKDVEIVKGVSYNLDSESIRVISSFPKFTPAMRNGVYVPKRYFVPVNFKLL